MAADVITQLWALSQLTAAAHPLYGDARPVEVDKGRRANRRPCGDNIDGLGNDAGPSCSRLTAQ